ncbi:MAG TPA: hypothetical protein VIU62_24225 [Chloroflexota bacterium]
MRRDPPEERRKQHDTHPAQPTRLDEVGAAGAHGLAVDALGRNAPPASPLDRLVHADDERAIRHEGGDQQTQQDATDRQAGPARPVEHPMVALEARSVGQSHHPQRGSNGAFARREQRARLGTRA